MDRETLTPDSDFGAIWQTVNNAGYGYAVGDDGDSVETAAECSGLDIVFERASDSDVLVCMDDSGNVVGVGDANGPWACKLGRMG